MTNFYEKLLNVQTGLKVPKGQFNQFGGYAYRSAADIQEAVKPLLAEQGMTMFIEDDVVLIGDRYYVRANVTLTDGETTLKVSSPAREQDTKKGMDASQITGSSSSYARKLALGGLFLIDDTADADATNDHSETAKPTKKQPAKDNGKARLKAACDRLQAACTAYETKVNPDKEPGWAMKGVQARPDFPAKDLPANERADWFNQVATEFEGELG